MISFKILKKSKKSRARLGVLKTPHGEVQTPAFVPVATLGAVKALTFDSAKRAGTQLLISNTFHLHLRPGEQIVKKMGGLHKFTSWDRPLMTDSGGFQVFSLGFGGEHGMGKILKEKSGLQIKKGDQPKTIRILENGVEFRSPINGEKLFIGPKESIKIQESLGADIIYAFDECTSPAEDFRYQEEALERTHRWAKRSLDHHHSLIRANGGINKQALFGIVQGGREESLRKRSAEFMKGLDFDGFGIGGSFSKDDMETVVKWVNEILPKDKPRHLLGIGEPEDLFMGVENGVDLFDCVAPTRNGRGGTLYTSRGKINIRNAEFREDTGPVDIECGCDVCKNYSRAYLCHLYRAHEMLGGTLGSIHNLYFIINLVKNMRQAILDNTFIQFREKFLDKYF